VFGGLPGEDGDDAFPNFPPGAPPFVPSGVLLTQSVSSTSNPTTSNDNTQGFAAGWVWINSNTGRMFVCRSAATSAAVWVLVGGGSILPEPVAGNWIQPYGMNNTVAGNAIGSTTIISLCPFVLHERCTISQLGVKIITVGSTNSQLGLYNASASTHMPTTNIDHTGNIVNTAVGAASGAMGGNQQLEAGLYWFAVEQNDVTIAYQAPALAASFFAQVVGNATLSNLIGANANTNTSACVSATIASYGTWGDLTNATFTVTHQNDAKSASGWLLVASVP
jgi:hypothetical protein